MIRTPVNDTREITYLETAGALEIEREQGEGEGGKHEDRIGWRRKDVQDTCTSLSLFLFGQIFLPWSVGSTAPISGQTHWCEFDREREGEKLAYQQTSRKTR